MALHFYTYSTSPEKAYYLFETAKFHGITIENLSPGTAWNGLKDKCIAMIAKVNSLPDDDIICFLDAYDVIVNADAETILKTFKEAKCEILFGAETNLCPESLNEYPYPESPTIFRYMNTGVYVGYVRAIRKMLQWGKFTSNDQEYMNLYFLKNNNGKDVNVCLDYYSKLALNMVGIPWSELRIENGLVSLKQTNTVPCIVHFNGMSFLDLNKDYVRQGDSLSFFYDKVYDRTFISILSSKMVTKTCDIVCYLTGRGSSY